jgi:hypothetical protein
MQGPHIHTPLPHTLPHLGPSWALLRLPFLGPKGNHPGPCGRQNFGHQCEPLHRFEIHHLHTLNAYPIARASRSRVCTSDLSQCAFSSHGKPGLSSVYFTSTSTGLPELRTTHSSCRPSSPLRLHGTHSSKHSSQKSSARNTRQDVVMPEPFAGGAVRWRLSPV